MRPPPPKPAPSWRSYGAAAARCAVGLVFAASGFHKAVLPAEEFSAVIEAYNLLPPRTAMTLAALLPWAELILGTYLAAGFLTRLCSAALGGMLLAFLGALLSARLRGIHLDNCGCFGAGIHLSPAVAMLLDAALLALAAAAFRRGAEVFSLDAWTAAGSEER